MKIVNTDGENFHIFWTGWGISMKFSGKMWLYRRDIIILKDKKTGLHLLSKRYVFEKPEGGQRDPPPAF